MPYKHKTMGLKNAVKQNEPSPAPKFNRAIYGFVLWLASYLFLTLYLIWAILPEEWLHYLGLTYWPMKYWAIAVPAYIITGLLLFAFVLYPSINLLITPPLNNIKTITDEFAITKPGRGIAPITDIPLSEVCEMLYTK